MRRRGNRDGRIILALRVFALVGTLLALQGCASLRYYVHVAQGQASLLTRREAVAKVVADPRRDAVLRARLRQAQAARAFASDSLALPRNRSYTSYVDLKRPYVTWNVFATPEFAVEPLTHCFPFAGCVAYQGYFDRAQAERDAQHLAAQGNDTQIEGAVAYSTLGWFADPILSSMLRWSDDELDSTIFHELAHQQLYVKDDTAFNESYASFVQEQGLREWRSARGLPPADESERGRDDAFSALVLDLREHLRQAYAEDVSSVAEKRAVKEREIAAFRIRYAQLRDAAWSGDARYDAWVKAPINNASLLPFGLYDRWVPAFAQLFEQSHGGWPLFFAKVRDLAREPRQQRDDALSRLATQTDTARAVDIQAEQEAGHP
ncbi:MAG: aminopeptidase [Dokdonella sp.]